MPEIIISQHHDGKIIRQIRTEFNIAKPTVGDIIKKFRETVNIDIQVKVQDGLKQ